MLTFYMYTNFSLASLIGQNGTSGHWESSQLVSVSIALLSFFAIVIEHRTNCCLHSVLFTASSCSRATSPRSYSPFPSWIFSCISPSTLLWRYHRSPLTCLSFGQITTFFFRCSCDAGSDSCSSQSSTSSLRRCFGRELSSSSSMNIHLLGWAYCLIYMYSCRYATSFYGF